MKTSFRIYLKVTLFVLLAVAVVLGAVGAWLYHDHKSKSWATVHYLTPDGESIERVRLGEEHTLLVPEEIEGVKIGVMLREVREGGKISVRTAPEYDAAAICARLGGGGHLNSAGCQMEGTTVPEAIEKVKQTLDGMIEEGELIL